MGAAMGQDRVNEVVRPQIRRACLGLADVQKGKEFHIMYFKLGIVRSISISSCDYDSQNHHVG